MITGFACGVFDLFHAGHVLMLKECREQCDKLVVGLNSAKNIDGSINPGKENPVFSVDHRKLLLESCKYVDEVVVYNNEAELLNLMIARRFQIRFLGVDYKNRPLTGEGVIPKIHWIKRDHGMSTSLYKELIRNRQSEELF